MATIAARYKEELPRIQEKIEKAYEYDKPNYDRYNKFRKFVFKTSLTDADKQILETRQMPETEFNVLEAFISRLRGEFSKQEPSISVMSDEGDKVDPQTLQIVEGHTRHILNEANKDGCEYNVYTDTLSGGFSVMKVWTEYAHPMSFNQVIKFGRVFDPVLCGFDPMARHPSKRDANFCFELYPKTKEDFEREYPNISIKNVTFTRNFQGFSWSYSSEKDDILLIADYYEKKKKRTKIVQLADYKNEQGQLITGQVMVEKDYQEFLEKWNSDVYKIEQAPTIKGKPRWTDIETICRYRLIENELLDYVETDYKALPLVFVDGNSILMRESTNSTIQHMTRPYVYHALGIQKLKNFAGQCLGNELENMVQHKFIICDEALPDGAYLDAYTNVQKAALLVHKTFSSTNPDVPLPPPREVARIPTPPEVLETFSVTDKMTQAILGSYDASLGINDNQLSGVAIVEGATQSNSAAMPYVVSFMLALNQVAEIIVDLIPKYYKTPRTIPIVGKDGKKTSQKINQQGGIDFNYDENALQVKVEAGLNFAVQKQRALNQIIALMQVSPLFAQFMNEKGLAVLLDNIEIRGIDILKDLSEEFTQEIQQQKQKMMEMHEKEMQNNPQMLKVQLERDKLEHQKKQDDVLDQIKLMELQEKKAQVELESAVMLDKAQAEKVRAMADLGMKAADLSHKHRKEHHELKHTIEMDHKNFNKEKKNV